MSPIKHTNMKRSMLFSFFGAIVLIASLIIGFSFSADHSKDMPDTYSDSNRNYEAEFYSQGTSYPKYVKVRVICLEDNSASYVRLNQEEAKLYHHNDSVWANLSGSHRVNRDDAEWKCVLK